MRGVVHLRSNGTLDPKWRLVSNGEIDALARFGTTLYVGGMFTSLSGNRRNGIAAVDTRTNTVLPWAPRLAAATDDGEPWVSTIALAAHGSAVYVGGGFIRVDGKRRSSIAAIDEKARPLPFNPHPDGAVSTIAVDPGGRAVYFAGDFGEVDGAERAGLAAADPESGRITHWDPQCDGDVDVIKIAPAGSPIYVGGGFASIGRKSRRGLGAVDAKTGAATPWDPNVGGSVRALLLEPKRKAVVVGGDFASVGDLDRSSPRCDRRANRRCDSLGSQGHRLCLGPRGRSTRRDVRRRRDLVRRRCRA